jgi:Type I phosphodiesterase / nucleotide pyrophosphatase
VTAPDHDWLPSATLADVLPAAAAALGVRVRPGSGPAAGGLELPEARVVVVLLVDGLGHQLLSERGGHAPFLRSLRSEPASAVLASGFPSTTATSMGMLGTGLLPGAHGLVGLEVLDPDRDVLFNELLWDPQVDPRRWQPSQTVFEKVAAAGLDVIRIGPGFFDGSGLTEAVQRGGTFVAAHSLEQRVNAALAAVRAARSGLVYVYWGDLDKTGHEHGCGSWRWIEELERVDAFTRRLAEGLPSDALLLVTADHGMVDVPLTARLDLAHEPDLAAGVRHVGGEPRSLQLYCRPGTVDDVAAAWRERLGSAMTVLTREQAVAGGWFGPVSAHVLPRIGDIVTSATEPVAVLDSRTARPEILRLKAFHGARTPEETLIPLLVASG